MMDLILWRHADAEVGSDDLARALTRKGQKQAREMASWLRPRLPNDYRLYASQAVRSQQTAAFLSKQYEVLPALNPDAAPEAVLAALGYPDAGSDKGIVVIVGHQPYIGRLAALLLAGQDQFWSVKKSGLWWLELKKSGEAGLELNRLKVMMTPGMLDGED
jgi:phosphohistidine phosphatase